MTCDELNLKYIDEKFKNKNITIEDSSLLQDVLEICKEFYREGFKQNLFDKRMLEHELEILKEESYREKSLKELYKDRIDKAIFFLENSDYGKMRFGIDLLEILKGGKDE